MGPRDDTRRSVRNRRFRGVPIASLVVVITATCALIVVAVKARQGAADAVDCGQAKCVALTFDDGPTLFTDRLLGILRDNDAKATFFLIGNKVAADPASARRIAEAGMEMGAHTWEHPNMTTIPETEIPAQQSHPGYRRGDREGARPVSARRGPV